MAQYGDPLGTAPAASEPRSATHAPRAFIEGDNVPRVLFLIPGSKSLAQWCIDVHRTADSEQWGVDVRIVPYSPPALWQVVLWPWQLWRRRQVKRQLDRMLGELPRHAEFFVAAHSFGTDILTHWLKEHVDHMDCSIFPVPQYIHGIIFISGIAKRKVVADIRNACNVLINDVAVDDSVPSWAAGLAGWRYDDIGTRGVVTGTARAIDRYFDGDHGTLVTIEHFRSNILPIVLGDGLPPGKHAGPKISARHVSRVRALRNIVLVAAAAAGITLCIKWATLAAVTAESCAPQGPGLCHSSGPARPPAYRPQGPRRRDTSSGMGGGGRSY
jgi:hypothetical protein